MRFSESCFKKTQRRNVDRAHTLQVQSRRLFFFFPARAESVKIWKLTNRIAHLERAVRATILVVVVVVENVRLDRFRRKEGGVDESMASRPPLVVWEEGIIIYVCIFKQTSRIKCQSVRRAMLVRRTRRGEDPFLLESYPLLEIPLPRCEIEKKKALLFARLSFFPL